MLFLQTWLNYHIQQDHLKAMILNEDLSVCITPDRAEQLRTAVEDFINSKTDSIALLNVSNAQAVLNIFRELYRTNDVQLQQLIKEKIAILTAKTSIHVGSKTSKISQVKFFVS